MKYPFPNLPFKATSNIYHYWAQFEPTQDNVLCYDLFDRHQKTFQIECFESSGWQIEGLECFESKIGWLKSSGWCFHLFNVLHVLPSGPGGQDGTICGALTGSFHLKVPHPFNIDAITLALRGICASARALVTYRTSLQSNLRKPPEIDEQWNQWVFLLSVLI